MERTIQSGQHAWSVGLNDRQRAAVEHEGGPLLIIAGAGTGKTRTLVSRLARLLESGVSPQRVLLVTFSRRAAAELVRRTAEFVDPAQAALVHAGTFHSIAHGVLRRCGSAVGLPESFSVLDPGDASDLLGLVRAPLASSRERRFPRVQTIAAIYGRVVSTRTPLETTVTRDYPWCVEHVEALREIFTLYTARKRARHLLDFEDLLLFWRAAALDPILGPALGAEYDHVLVDEYQDTSVVQAEILRALRSGDDRITVVGDDAQAIYSFRSATVRNILDFPEHFPGATQISLEENYRSSAPILALANAVIAEAHEGFAKRLWTRRDGGTRPVLATCPDQASQADAVCDSILEHHESGVSLRNQAVLVRASHHSDLLEVELRRRRIPYAKFGGLRFLESAHIRDLLALLRVLENPRDELAWTRVVQLADGVGQATARRLVEHLVLEGDGGDPLDRFVGDPTGGIAARARNDLEAIATALDRCRGGVVLGAQIELVASAIEPMIRQRYEHPEPRLADFTTLARLAGDFSTRDRFVAELTLDPPSSTGDLAGPPSLDDDWLTISTVHSAKGGEWDVVHVLHLADGAFPSDLATRDDVAIDEERRLFYVALTRARRHLHLYAPLRYHHGPSSGWRDSHSYAQRTRFLPPELDDLLEHRAVRSRADLPLPCAANAIPEVVDASLGELW